jgi:hypothetical protein
LTYSPYNLPLLWILPPPATSAVLSTANGYRDATVPPPSQPTSSVEMLASAHHVSRTRHISLHRLAAAAMISFHSFDSQHNANNHASLTAPS